MTTDPEIAAPASPPAPKAPTADQLVIQVRQVANQAMGMCIVLDQACKALADRAATSKTRALVETAKAREHYVRAAESTDILSMLGTLGESAQTVLHDLVRRNPWLALEMGLTIQIPTAQKKQEVSVATPPGSS